MRIIFLRRDFSCEESKLAWRPHAPHSHTRQDRSVSWPGSIVAITSDGHRLPSLYRDHFLWNFVEESYDPLIDLRPPGLLAMPDKDPVDEDGYVDEDFELSEEDVAELMDGVPDPNDPWPPEDDPDIPF